MLFSAKTETGFRNMRNIGDPCFISKHEPEPVRKLVYFDRKCWRNSIEVVVRDYQFYITVTSICIFTFLNINGVMQNHIAQFSLKG